MRKVLLAILMMGILALQAQEHISVLESNPLLQTKQKQMPKMRTTFALSLPFLDDFSYNSYFPDNLLWEDSAVFVNRSYPINPVTIGVATFDGLDANGLAYDIQLQLKEKEQIQSLQKLLICRLWILLIYYFIIKQKDWEIIHKRRTLWCWNFSQE